MNNHGKKIYLVSGCLMGLKTRYDATAKASEECRNFLKGSIWIPICPEQLGGLPTPRLPAEIIGGNGSDVLTGKARVVNADGVIVSDQFISGALQVLLIAEKQNVTGVILKSGSPSCGSGVILGVTAALLLNKGFHVIEL